MTDKETVLALRIHNDKKLSDCSKCPLSNYNNCYELLLQNAIYWIEYLATSRTQGEWLPNYTSQFMNPGRQCSLCGKIVEFSENYCPQCGADMRGNNNEKD